MPFLSRYKFCLSSQELVLMLITMVWAAPFWPCTMP